MEERTQFEQQESGSEGRTRIINAAYPLFVAHGYKGVSMQQIADAAQIHKATLYHHFRHKDDLFSSVVLTAMINMRGRLTRILGECDAPTDQLVEAACQIFSHTQSDFGRLMTDMHENVPAEIRAQVMRESTMPWELFEQFFVRAMEEGSLPEIDPRLATSLFVGMVWGQIWITKSAELMRRPLDRDLARTIVQTLFVGLRGQNGPTVFHDVASSQVLHAD